MMNYKETITPNLEALSTATVVSVELATLALQNGIVTQEEFEHLNAAEGSGFTNYNKATFLYTRIARKWTESEFGVFLSVLEQSGNASAVEILTSKSSAARSYNNLTLVENILATKRNVGQFEGYLLEDELEAKMIVELYDTKPEGFLDVFRTLFKLSDAPFKVAQQRKERLIQMLSSGKVWWNPTKPQLPPYYIDRRVFNENAQETTLVDLVVPSNNDDPDWDKWNGEVLILLVDGPGMGKSSALTRLEQELREKLNKSPRVIVRIDLNRIRGGGIEDGIKEGVQKVMTKLFEPLNDICATELDSPIYILLDGLEEVLPQKQDSVLSVIRFLLSDNSITKGWVIEKVVLTTRPHLKELIESSFKVRAHSLVPLTKQNQVEFIQKKTGCVDAQKLLVNLPWEIAELMSNPLMLSMYCDLVDLTISSRDSKSLDRYDVYLKFMVKKHELYVTEKRGMSYLSKRVLKDMFDTNVPFYNYLAMREILGEDKFYNLYKICDLDKSAQIIEPDPAKTSELISFGVVVKDKNELKFAHRTFTEFFYAKLMTDVKNTPKELRNALFALGYTVRTNLAEFVSGIVVKDAEKVQFLSEGWTKFVPEEGETLGRYVEKDGIVFDHIMSSTIEYEGSCPGKNELLARDIWEGGVLLQWLHKTKDQESIRNFLLNENNTRMLAAFVFCVPFKSQYDDDRKKFLTLIKQCKEALFERITWMPLKEREVIAQDFLRVTRNEYDSADPCICTLLASAFSRNNYTT